MKKPKGWRIEQLGWAVSSLESGISESGEEREPGPNEPAVLKVSAVTGKKFAPYQCKALAGKLEGRNRTFVKGDRILVNRANGSATLVGSSVYVPEDYPNRFLPDKIWQLAANESNSTARFLHIITSTKRFKQQVLNESSGGTGMKNIGSRRYLEIEVAFPPLPEQRKIADILTTWDEALTQLDALIEAQERRKKALMQQLLTRASSKAGTRHARQRMGCVLERVTRRNSSLNDNVLTISAQGGLVSQKEYFNRSVAGADLSGYYLLHRGEFAYNRSYSNGYPYGALKRLDQFDSGVVSTLYLCFRIKEGAAVSPDYLVHYFEGGRLNSGLRCIAKEGARAHGLLNVTADEFFDLDIFLPSLPEQQKIAEILDTADQQLTLLRTQRTTLDQQKRGLIQRLLTGKLRVKINTPTS